MEAPSLFGMGIGFAIVGAIFSALLARKPDLGMFKKYTEKQFCRTQGSMAMFILFGLLLVCEGAFVLMGPAEGENLPASLMGIGAGIAVVGLVFGLLSIYRPNMRIFKGYTGKKLYQGQGALMTAAAFGMAFFVLGLMGKPWAV